MRTDCGSRRGGGKGAADSMTVDSMAVGIITIDGMT